MEMGLVCELELDNETGVYQPGDTVSGSIVLTLEERALIKAFAVKVSGYAVTRWEKPPKPQKYRKTDLQTVQSKPKAYYTSREDYLLTINYFMGSEEALAKIVDSGTYGYTFAVRLPENCPSSFESYSGHIRYDLEVFIVGTDGKHICQARSMRVQRTLDLRAHSMLMQGPDLEVTEKIPRTKFWLRPLQIHLNVTKTGYIPGERVSVYVKVLNYQQLRLTELVYRLNLIGTYTGTHKKKCKEQVVRTNLVKSLHSLFGQNGNVVQHLQVLQVPETPPSTDCAHCKCIQIAYEVDVTVHSEKRQRTLSAQLPITIGTISLHSSFKTLSREFSGSAPVVSLARSVSDLRMLPAAGAVGGEAYAATAPPLESPNRSASLSSLTSSFREAGFMATANLNKPNKHPLQGDKSTFKPKYLYYDMNNIVQETEVSSTTLASTAGTARPEKDNEEVCH